MTIAQAMAELRRKWPESPLCINVVFWEHKPNQLSVQWSVWIEQMNRHYYGTTLDVPIELATHPDGHPTQAAAIVEQAAESFNEPATSNSGA